MLRFASVFESKLRIPKFIMKLSFNRIGFFLYPQITAKQLKYNLLSWRIIEQAPKI